MFRFKLSVIFCIIFSILLLSGCGGINSGSLGSTVSGNVKIATETQPYPPCQGAKIYLDNNLLAITDENGSFELFNISKGEYTLKIEAEYFKTCIQSIYISGNEDHFDTYYLVPADETCGLVVGKVNIFNSTNYTATASSMMNKQNLSEKISLKKDSDYPDFYRGEILIKYKPSVSIQSQKNLLKAQGLEFVKVLKQDRNGSSILKCKIPPEKEMYDMLNYYNGLPEIEWAEPNYKVYATSIPDDKRYNEQWGHLNANLEAAWDIEKGSNGILVAVIDTGLVKHSDLDENVFWEKGKDFVDEDLVPIDDTPKESGGSHGTHVAGIIGAVTDNFQGVAGVNWNVTIVPIRVLGSNGEGELADVIEGIEYAIYELNVDIINLSLGMDADSQALREVIEDAYNAGITVVAAAGNGGFDGIGDSSLLYPAGNPTTISVGAVGRDNQLASYSNYGYGLDLVAPGGDAGEFILSTWGYNGDEYTVFDDYVYMQGTSMATAYVSGIAALLMANGVYGPEAIKDRLINTAVDLGEEGYDEFYGYGLVDAYGALLGRRLGNPSVFAVKLNGNEAFIISDEVIAQNDGSFLLVDVDPAEDVYIMAIRDFDGDYNIDPGEYYGISEQPLDVYAGNAYQGIVNMYYVTESSTITSLKK